MRFFERMTPVACLVAWLEVMAMAEEISNTSCMVILISLGIMTVALMGATGALELGQKEKPRPGWPSRTGLHW